MKKICLVSYMCGKESFTDEMVELGTLLHDSCFDFQCIIFTDGLRPVPEEALFPIKQIQLEGTKYKRLKQLIQNEDADYYISVDNDVEFNLPVLKKFVEKVVDGAYDVGWAKILAKPSPNLIPRLVEIDKNLSHHYLRPILWKSGVGITIPGQCFIIKRNTFIDRLPEIDTYLDDLALGLYVNINSNALTIYHGEEVVGYEEANDSFIGLFKQRARWAKGFMSIWQNTTAADEKKLITIHGLSYHSLWLLHWFCIAILMTVSPMVALGYIFTIALTLTNMNYRLFTHAVLYQFIFPVFHLRWLQCALAELKCKY